MAEQPAPTVPVPSAAEPASTPASSPKLSLAQPPGTLDWEGSELEPVKAELAKPPVVFRLNIAPSVMDDCRVSDDILYMCRPLEWD